MYVALYVGQATTTTSAAPTRSTSSVTCGSAQSSTAAPSVARSTTRSGSPASSRARYVAASSVRDCGLGLPTTTATVGAPVRTHDAALCRPLPNGTDEPAC